MMKALECIEDVCKKMIPSVINWIGGMENGTCMYNIQHNVFQFICRYMLN